MSDDLISRKAVLDILTEERVRSALLASPAFTEMLAQHIKKLPTAFDKEKVLYELYECRRLILHMASSDCVKTPCKESDCTLCIFEKVFEIVEKGGIE